MKFRKKPIVIEAEQFFEKDGVDGVKMIVEHVLGYSILKYFIDTLEGRMQVKDGDWIITGIAGEKYPCKPDIFEKTYERVENE